METLRDTVDTIDSMIDKIQRAKVSTKQDLSEFVMELQMIRAIVVQLAINS